MSVSDPFNARLDQAVKLFLSNTSPEEARNVLFDCLKEQPGNVDVLFWLAKSSWHDRSDFEEAESFMKKAVSIDPSRTDCKDLLIGVLLGNGTAVEELLPLQEDIVREQPDWIIPREQLVIFYDTMGNRAQADEELQVVINLMRKHRESGKFKDYSYYEACVTGRHVREDAEGQFVRQVEWLRKHKDKT